jgi:hypothetical protein
MELSGAAMGGLGAVRDGPGAARDIPGRAAWVRPDRGRRGDGWMEGGAGTTGRRAAHGQQGTGKDSWGRRWKRIEKRKGYFWEYSNLKVG